MGEREGDEEGEMKEDVRKDGTQREGKKGKSK